MLGTATPNNIQGKQSLWFQLTILLDTFNAVKTI